ncbi:hypothetical protein [Allocoprobacillus halotolerans]|nr:hypothetical protein [Allocoprobacillus halotolerans]
MYKRTVFNKIEQSLELNPIVIVTGPKLVGKTIEVYRLVETHGFH